LVEEKNVKIVVLAILALATFTGIVDAQECSSRQTTQDIVECTDGQTKAWDRKLNASYQTLMQAQSDEQRTRLRTAQRLWIQYRQANCDFYRGGDGSISRIEAAACMFKMTKGRALELEHGEMP
jgi:uncharacterized protein YecT (DUF1311 family)